MLTKQDKREILKLVDHRNEHLKGSRSWDVIEYCITFLLMIVLAFSIRSVIFEPMRVKGSSMENTLLPGDYMAVEKLSYILKPMKRGDVEYDFVEVMACPGGCVGGGGQPIAFNQELGPERACVLNSMDGADVLRVTTGLTPRHDGTYIVEQGCVFVMGDNRLVSRDSTDGMVGSIPVARVIGRVDRVLFPFSRSKRMQGVQYGV